MVAAGLITRHNLVAHRDARDIVLEQYRMCAGILKEIYAVCPNTTWARDGIGSCKWHGEWDDDIGGLIVDWANLRHQRLDEKMPERPAQHSACSYHKPDVGCVLDELISPKCLAHFDRGMQLPESFVRLGDVKAFLQSILSGQSRPYTETPPDPTANWARVQEFVKLAKVVLSDARRAALASTGRVPLVVKDL